MIFSCILVVFAASLATGLALPAGTKTSELSNVQPNGYISGGGVSILDRDVDNDIESAPYVGDAGHHLIDKRDDAATVYKAVLLNEEDWMAALEKSSA
ncbi:hypothetical protein MAP00_005824 [Monascus purpureus]|nr:hypothetical protein MAP00_005824 [Monascus purpureus]